MAQPLQTLTSLVDENKFDKEFIMEEDERPKVAHNEYSEEIPVISLAGIDDDQSGGKREEIRRRIAEACVEWGIFQVVDHGFDAKLIHDMTSLSRQFFALPDEKKLKFSMCGGKRGGFVVSSHLKNESVANWREIMVYLTYPIKDRDYSRWADEPKEWRDITSTYSEKVMGLGCKLMEIISEAMGVEKDSMYKASGEMSQKMVVNYYPKCPRPDLAVGMKRHTDVASITLLLQDNVGGLQATKDDGHTWVTIKPIDGAFVVNLGDFAHYLSNGKFKSADHRAVVNNDSTRLSIATFITPEQEAIVYPLKVDEGTNPILEKPITFADLYKSAMILHLQRNKLKENKLQNGDIVKFV